MLFHNGLSTLATLCFLGVGSFHLPFPLPAITIYLIFCFTQSSKGGSGSSKEQGVDPQLKRGCSSSIKPRICHLKGDYEAHS